jgi:hypothetical protein
LACFGPGRDLLKPLNAPAPKSALQRLVNPLLVHPGGQGILDAETELQPRQGFLVEGAKITLGTGLQAGSEFFRRTFNLYSLRHAGIIMPPNWMSNEYQPVGGLKPPCILRRLRTTLAMGLPSQPVALSVEELDQLQQRLASLRHDINNHLSLIMAAVELIRHKPEVTERMMSTLAEQPSKISQALSTFTADFERALGITRPQS